MDYMDWSNDRFEAITAKSQALHGNKNMLPVAVAISESGMTTVKTPQIAVALAGRIPPNRILEALVRLCLVGVLVELPYPGRPAPRIFETRPSSFWEFANAFATEGIGDGLPAGASDVRPSPDASSVRTLG